MIVGARARKENRENKARWGRLAQKEILEQRGQQVQRELQESRDP
ncbi:hypothetical protein I4000191A8_17340 [Clostridia bacterium i40-0019-1A8]